MDRTSALFIVWMGLGGLGLALAGVEAPAMRAGPVPPMMWLLPIAFLFDATVMLVGGRLGLRPLSMGVRLGGVVVGAAVYMLADMTLLGQASPAIAAPNA